MHEDFFFLPEFTIVVHPTSKDWKIIIFAHWDVYKKNVPHFSNHIKVKFEGKLPIWKKKKLKTFTIIIKD